MPLHRHGWWMTHKGLQLKESPIITTRQVKEQNRKFLMTVFVAGDLLFSGSLKFNKPDDVLQLDLRWFADMLS